MTFNGSWHKVRVDPAAKFMVLALVFYAVSTFEGSMMAIKSVNSLTHYTDWTVAHVHFGAIGWVAMITIGSLYAMAPRALDRPAMHSTPAMNLHFWLHTSGLLLYVMSMWAAGVIAGSDVARDERGWIADPRFPVGPDRHAALLPGALPGRSAGAQRHGGHGVEPVAHRRRRARRRDQAHPGSGARGDSGAGPRSVPGAAAGKGPDHGQLQTLGKAREERAACSAC